MSKWVLIVVAVVGVGWFGYSKLQERKAQRVEAALARVACETDLFSEAAAVVDRFSRNQGTRDELTAERDVLLTKLDEAAVAHGAKPGELASISAAGTSAVVNRATRLDSLVHEVCPTRYNENKEEFQRACAAVAAMYGMRH